MRRELPFGPDHKRAVYIESVDPEWVEEVCSDYEIPLNMNFSLGIGLYVKLNKVGGVCLQRIEYLGRTWRIGLAHELYVVSGQKMMAPILAHELSHAYMHQLGSNIGHGRDFKRFIQARAIPMRCSSAEEIMKRRSLMPEKQIEDMLRCETCGGSEDVFLKTDTMMLNCNSCQLTRMRVAAQQKMTEDGSLKFVVSKASEPAPAPAQGSLLMWGDEKEKLKNWKGK